MAARHHEAEKSIQLVLRVVVDLNLAAPLLLSSHNSYFRTQRLRQALFCCLDIGVLCRGPLCSIFRPRRDQLLRFAHCEKSLRHGLRGLNLLVCVGKGKDSACMTPTKTTAGEHVEYFIR